MPQWRKAEQPMAPSGKDTEHDIKKIIKVKQPALSSFARWLQTYKGRTIDTTVDKESTLLHKIRATRYQELCFNQNVESWFLYLDNVLPGPLKEFRRL